MKKNEYIAPEVEIVEITEQGSLLQAISETGPGTDWEDGGDGNVD